MQICRFRVGFFVKPHNPAPQRIRWGEGGRSHATTHRTTDAAGLEPRDECAGCPGCPDERANRLRQRRSDSLTPEKLLELIRDERADSALYAHLACRMKGKAQAMLREMARQEACHAKQFGAVYFLKTGKRPVPAGRMRRASPASTKRSASAIPRSTPRMRRMKRSPKTPERTAVCC